MSKNNIQISKELYDLLCEHFKVGIKFDLGIANDDTETRAEYYQREDRIKALLTEKNNKMLLRSAYKKVIDAPEGEEKEKAKQFYDRFKKTL